jgi:K+-sensing histidine kinase KdpD
MSDATLLHSILCNLIRNGIKYTPRAVESRGMSRQCAECAHRSSDTGNLIPPDHLSKVFDAFHRLDSTEPDGWGLGLFVVRQAADLLAIASGSDPQSGTDHVFRSWPEQDGQQIGVPKLPESRSTTGLRRCSPV